MKSPIILKARTVLLDWFDLGGFHIGYGNYISTRQSTEEMILELMQLARKGKRPGLETIEPDGISELSVSVVIRPLDRAIGICDHETHKVPYDSSIPCRLVNFFEDESITAITNQVVEMMLHEKTATRPSN